MLWVYQCIVVPDIKFSIVHIMHYHIHTAEVVGSGVALLTVKSAYFFYLFCNTQQQGTRTAGWVVYAF
ncbi:hypothetical protein ES708_31923 [subsurface metagenome]